MTWKSLDESSAERQLEHKVWKVGNMAITIDNNGISCVQCRLGRGLPPMGRKRGVCSFWGAAGLTQYGLGWGLPPYQGASWSIQPFGHDRHGPKSGGCCAPFWGNWVPSNNNCQNSRYIPAFYFWTCTQIKCSKQRENVKQKQVNTGNSSNSKRCIKQEAQKSQRDHATHYVSWNRLHNCMKNCI